MSLDGHPILPLHQCHKAVDLLMLVHAMETAHDFPSGHSGREYLGNDPLFSEISLNVSCTMPSKSITHKVIILRVLLAPIMLSDVQLLFVFQPLLVCHPGSPSASQVIVSTARR